MQHFGKTLCICCQSLHLHATCDDFFLVQAHRKIWIIIYDDSTPCVCYRPNITSCNNMTRDSAKLAEGRNTNSSIFSKGVKKTIPLQKIFGYCKGNTKKYQHKYHICKHHLLLSSWTDEKEKKKYPFNSENISHLERRTMTYFSLDLGRGACTQRDTLEELQHQSVWIRRVKQCAAPQAREMNGLSGLFQVDQKKNMLGCSEGWLLLVITAQALLMRGCSPHCFIGLWDL